MQIPLSYTRFLQKLQIHAHGVSERDHSHCRRSALVSFLTNISQRLRDRDLIYAVQHMPVADIKALLSRPPSGPLRPREECHSGEPSYNPLRAVVHRKELDKDTIEILDIFLQRVADINSGCDPANRTALHCFVTVDRHQSNAKEFLNVLIRRCADPSISIPDGNVLELLWEIANTTEIFKYSARYRDEFERTQQYAPIIRCLIEAGAVNRRTDPNVQLPDLRSMLTFATTNHLFHFGRKQYLCCVVLTHNTKEGEEQYRHAYDTCVPSRLARHREQRASRTSVTKSYGDAACGGIPSDFEILRLKFIGDFPSSQVSLEQRHDTGHLGNTSITRNTV